MGITKRHHFIPQNVIRRFTHSDGRVYFGCTATKKVTDSTPANVFLVKGLNIFHRADGTPDDALETRFYSPIDNTTKKLIDEFEDAVLSGKTLVMDDKTRATWDQIFYNFWKRSPEFHEFPEFYNNSGEYIKTLMEDRDRAGHHIDPDEVTRILEPRNVKEIIQNARVKTLARQSPEVLRILSNRSICWAVTEATKSFVLASKPVLSLRDRSNPHLDNAKNEAWLPITPRICAVMTGVRGQDRVVQISAAQVRSINLRLANQSRFIASGSEKLIVSILNAR